MTRPAVSAAAEEMYASLKAIAEEDEANNWILLLQCESLMGNAIQPIVDISRDTDAGPGWSSLLDLNNTPDDALPYLAQFVGVVTDSNASPAQNRDVILNRPPWKRGRPDTLKAAVQATLTGTKRYALLERDTSPYHAKVQVYRAQMPNEAATRAALAANKPGMIILLLEILEAPSYGDIRTSLPANTYGDREDEYPTYGDVREYVP